MFINFLIILLCYKSLRTLEIILLSFYVTGTSLHRCVDTSCCCVNLQAAELSLHTFPPTHTLTLGIAKQGHSSQNPMPWEFHFARRQIHNEHIIQIGSSCIQITGAFVRTFGTKLFCLSCIANRLDRCCYMQHWQLCKQFFRFRFDDTTVSQTPTRTVNGQTVAIHTDVWS